MIEVTRIMREDILSEYKREIRIAGYTCQLKVRSYKANTYLPGDLESSKLNGIDQDAWDRAQATSQRVEDKVSHKFGPLYWSRSGARESKNAHIVTLCQYQ